MKNLKEKLLELVLLQHMFYGQVLGFKNFLKSIQFSAEARTEKIHLMF